MRTPFWLAILLSLLATAWALRGPVPPPGMIFAEEQLPPGAFILDPSKATAMLRQCSRANPPAADSGWRPEPSDIVALERTLLPTLLARTDRLGVDWSKQSKDWTRQYVGIVRGGRHFIYGSFVPAWAFEDNQTHMELWRNEPVIFCDGGPEFFGVEFDLEAGRFSHFAFNHRYEDDHAQISDES